MEEKIYDRQVTKQSLSARVVDKHQIDRHYTLNELAELYHFDDPSKNPKPEQIYPHEDYILANVMLKYERIIWNVHKHDSRLENKVRHFNFFCSTFFYERND